MKLNVILEGQVSKFYAYRIGGHTEDLAGKNAANIEGIPHFLELDTHAKYHPRKVITKYEITHYKRKFGRYKTYDDAFLRSIKHVPNQSEDPIGQIRFGNKVIWYSFPPNGAWDYKVIGSVPASKINERFREEYGEGLEERSGLRPNEMKFLAQAIRKEFR